jgi:hypothetical protein
MDPSSRVVVVLRASVAPLVVVATMLTAACGQRVTTIGEWQPPEPSIFFEAEAGELTGFRIETDDTASNGAFIVPDATETFDAAPGAARGRYEFTLDYEFRVVIWGRIRSPDVGANRFWFKLDDDEWTKWRITVGDIWYWDDLHEDTDYGERLEFELTAGKHELWIANSTARAALDRLFISAGARPSAISLTQCKPPHSIELEGECHASCGSQNGTACGETACAGKTLIESYDCDVCCPTDP